MSNSLWHYGPWCSRFLSPWDSLGKNTGASCHSLLQEFSRISSQPKDWTQAFCIADRLFTIWSTREDGDSCIYVYIYIYIYVFSSVLSLSRVWFFAPHGPQHPRAPCPSPIPRVYPNSRPLSRWFHPTNLFTAIPFSSCLQSFPKSGSFQMSQLFASGGQSIGVSASISALPMNIQDWYPLGWTLWISLQSKGLF